MFSIENNSITRGEFADLLNRETRVFTPKLRFRWRLGAIRGRDCCSHHEFFKARRRKDKEIVIRNLAGVTQLMGNVAWRHQAVARLQDENLTADVHFQLAGDDVVCFVFKHVRVTGDTDPRRETGFNETICASRIRTGETHRTDAHVDIPAFRLRLMFDGGSPAVSGIERRGRGSLCFHASSIAGKPADVLGDSCASFEQPC